MSDSFATPWTEACQAPLSMGFPRHKYWGGLPFSSPGDLPNSGIKRRSSALAGGFFTTEPRGKPTTSDTLSLLFLEYCLCHIYSSSGYIKFTSFCLTLTIFQPSLCSLSWLDFLDSPKMVPFVSIQFQKHFWVSHLISQRCRWCHSNCRKAKRN